jgi:hypothetical protein
MTNFNPHTFTRSFPNPLRMANPLIVDDACFGGNETIEVIRLVGEGDNRATTNGQRAWLGVVPRHGVDAPSPDEEVRWHCIVEH